MVIALKKSPTLKKWNFDALAISYCYHSDWYQADDAITGTSSRQLQERALSFCLTSKKRELTSLENDYPNALSFQGSQGRARHVRRRGRYPECGLSNSGEFGFVERN
jgi:hypothetical protein